MTLCRHCSKVPAAAACFKYVDWWPPDNFSLLHFSSITPDLPHTSFPPFFGESILALALQDTHPMAISPLGIRILALDNSGETPNLTANASQKSYNCEFIDFSDILNIIMSYADAAARGAKQSPEDVSPFD
jgi:hypothetical protein